MENLNKTKTYADVAKNSAPVAKREGKRGKIKPRGNPKAPKTKSSRGDDYKQRKRPTISDSVRSELARKAIERRIARRRESKAKHLGGKVRKNPKEPSSLTTLRTYVKPDNWNTLTRSQKANWRRRQRRRPARKAPARSPLAESGKKPAPKGGGPVGPNHAMSLGDVRLRSAHSSLTTTSTDSSVSVPEYFYLGDKRKGGAVFDCQPADRALFESAAPDGVAYNRKGPVVDTMSMIMASAVRLFLSSISVDRPVTGLGVHPSWADFDHVVGCYQAGSVGRISKHQSQCNCHDMSKCKELIRGGVIVVGPGFTGNIRSVFSLGEVWLVHLVGKQTKITYVASAGVYRATMKDQLTVEIEKGVGKLWRATKSGAQSRTYGAAALTFLPKAPGNRVWLRGSLSALSKIPYGGLLFTTDGISTAPERIVDSVENVFVGRERDELTGKLAKRHAVRLVEQHEGALLDSDAETVEAAINFAERQSILRGWRWMSYRAMNRILANAGFGVAAVGLSFLSTYLGYRWLKQRRPRGSFGIDYDQFDTDYMKYMTFGEYATKLSTSGHSGSAEVARESATDELTIEAGVYIVSHFASFVIDEVARTYLPYGNAVLVLRDVIYWRTEEATNFSLSQTFGASFAWAASLGSVGPCVAVFVRMCRLLQTDPWGILGRAKAQLDFNTNIVV